jgi:phospholipase/carboxylesterase
VKDTTGRGFTRRDILAAGMAGMAIAAACRARLREEDGIVTTKTRGTETANPAKGRLGARPGAPETTATAGLHPLGFGERRDGLLYVPKGYRADRPAPLVLMLHGAGGNAHGGLAPYREAADSAGLILLAPESRKPSWDVIQGEFGPDVTFIDRALAWTFDRCAVDPGRIVAEGFSDGASYALSIGLTNGDLFTHVIAFSPGFMVPADQRGKPRIFISHGKIDQVLPISNCSRRIVPRLESAGYEVLYQEFEGPHTVPPAIVRQSLDWLLPAGVIRR